MIIINFKKDKYVVTSEVYSDTELKTIAETIVFIGNKGILDTEDTLLDLFNEMTNDNCNIQDIENLSEVDM
ncbi:MAG: hypothetical protein ACRCXT_23960 [Paraclostridium sp.]